jgi:hypothetical protein
MMRQLPALVPLLAVLAAAVPGPVLASPASDAFATSCSANGDFLEATTGLTLGRDDTGRICSCLVTAFEGAPDKDFEMLTKDIENTATAADRTAYGDYTALESKALAALTGCLVAEGLADGAEPADMTAFEKACLESEGLLGVIPGDPEQRPQMRETLCQCLSGALGPQISTADAEILAADLDGSATEEARQAHPGYVNVSEVARIAFNGCMATLRPAQ